jgi:hypothetical protein
LKSYLFITVQGFSNFQLSNSGEKEENNISEDTQENGEHEQKYEDTPVSGIKTILGKAFHTLDQSSALKLPEFITKKLHSVEVVDIDQKTQNK